MFLVFYHFQTPFCISCNPVIFDLDQNHSSCNIVYYSMLNNVTFISYRAAGVEHLMYVKEDLIIPHVSEACFAIL